jgi:hypothetical protein
MLAAAFAGYDGAGGAGGARAGDQQHHDGPRLDEVLGVLDGVTVLGRASGWVAVDGRAELVGLEAQR